MDGKATVTVFSATEFELGVFKDWAKANMIQLPVAIRFVTTGVGALSTCFAVTRQLLTDKPHFALQAGIGGLLDDAFLPETVYAIGSDQIADLGVEEENGWQSVFDMGLAGSDLFPFENGMLPNPHFHRFLQPSFQPAAGFTVNRISHLGRHSHHPENADFPLIESMEGAAFHYACLQTGTPFLQLRTASNLVGERNKNSWRLKEAVSALNHALIEWFSSGVLTAQIDSI